MIITVLLIICAIVFILALLYIIGCLVSKRELSTRKKYQDHIRGLVDELFPSTIQTPDVQTAIDQLQTSNEDLEYQEAKRNMVANIRKYFNQRKINATLANVQRSKDFVSVNPYNKQTFPTPPSLQRLLE